MKCLDALQLILGGDEKEFSSELRAHLDACAECRRIHRRNQAVLQLIGLKRYERRDPQAAARSRAKIREQIASPEPGFLRFWEILKGEVLVPVRLGAAAVVLALAGLYTVSLSPHPVQKAETPAQAQTQPLLPDLSLAAVSNPAPVQPLAQATETPVILVSNQGPNAIQYGTEPSVPVKFEP